MEENITIKNDKYDIPAALCLPKNKKTYPAVILCHGTASNKDEVGGLFKILARTLRENNIASIRFDFAGCGQSKAPEEELTFLGEVSDTEKVLEYLKSHPNIKDIGILGFSQGARVMAHFLGKNHQDISFAVSWSGACHNGKGAFEILFKEYYDIASRDGIVKIPMKWRDDITVSKTWFDEIKDTKPLDSLSKYKGPILAISGSLDKLVDPNHSKEIANSTSGNIKDYKIYKDMGHNFNILSDDKKSHQLVIKDTVNWITKQI